ncbi:membrane protein, putative [Babesia bigemina]|uniref:Membrane protein, putative n=1 Tax=Babesia bigemina TaxID=5866 RepID=A0A061D6F4_BABBI|nr:membrane protein, putative [Babesia bigemina]CDR95597.1 membrane protein, putative [Babesia bigemina]|eukprot:XP_012767783.1 membrane protein, putative [Babesia bigemina]
MLLPLLALLFNCAVVRCRCDAELDSAARYEARYGTQLAPSPPDEEYAEPLGRLAFGSCQQFDLGDNRIFPAISRARPDLFLYTGDIVYPDNHCGTPECLRGYYTAARNHPVYSEFRRQLRRIDGIYDDHDFGMNDGHDSFQHREASQQILLDFLEKPAGHYRRRRAGAYFSAEYRNPHCPVHRVKVIVLDMRYHRNSFYYCACHNCHWYKPCMHHYIVRRLWNYLSGFGCNHGGDTLGQEQWRWLEGQLHQSQAETHVIVSSTQVFTKFPVAESWGLLPDAKERLTQLLLATKPKNPIFISGDVHWGGILEADGIVEVTSSSLTHSMYVEFAKIQPVVSFVLQWLNLPIYGYNNFGIIDFEHDDRCERLSRHIKLMDDEGKVVMDTFHDGYEDPMEPYRGVDQKATTFLRNTRIVHCTSLLWKVALISTIAATVYCAFVVAISILRRLFKRRHAKKDN